MYDADEHEHVDYHYDDVVLVTPHRRMRIITHKHTNAHQAITQTSRRPLRRRLLLRLVSSRQTTYEIFPLYFARRSRELLLQCITYTHILETAQTWAKTDKTVSKTSAHFSARTHEVKSLCRHRRRRVIWHLELSARKLLQYTAQTFGTYPNTMDRMMETINQSADSGLY